MRLSTRAIRTVERNGGIDAFLLAHPQQPAAGTEALALKRRILRARERKPAA